MDYLRETRQYQLNYFGQLFLLVLKDVKNKPTMTGGLNADFLPPHCNATPNTASAVQPFCCKEFVAEQWLSDTDNCGLTVPMQNRSISLWIWP
jgi:hypothetical protein